MFLQVGSYVSEKTPAGGHQGYAALGGLYTQARPMCTHLYGPLYQQEQMIPVSLTFNSTFNVSCILNNAGHQSGLFCHSFLL